MHSILEVGSEQLRLFYYTAQERQIQMKYDALLVAHRVNSNTNRQKEKICLKIILTSISVSYTHLTLPTTPYV